MVAGKRIQAETLQQNLRKKPVGREENFYKLFRLIMSGKFRYQPFVAISGNRGGKVPVVDVILSSQERKNYPTISIDETCVECDFQTDRN